MKICMNRAFYKMTEMKAEMKASLQHSVKTVFFNFTVK